MRPDTIVQQCRNKFSPEQMAEMAGKMASEVSELQRTRDEKKVSDKAFNERIERHTAEVINLAEMYNKGYKLAEIECDIRYNHPEPGKKTFIRMDTKEELSTVDMNWEEQQEELQLNIPEAPAAESQPDGEASTEQITEALNGIQEATEQPPKSDFRELKEGIDKIIEQGPPRILPADELPADEDMPF